MRDSIVLFSVICFVVSSPVDQDGYLDPRILPHWSGISIAEFFSDKDLSIRIENDANAGAFAERWWNQEVDDFIYLKVRNRYWSGIFFRW